MPTTGTTTSGMGGWDWGQIFQLGAQLYGSYAQSQGAKNSANASAAGSNAAIGEQRRQFDLIFGMLQPQYQVGTQALNALGRLYGYTPYGANQGAPGAGNGGPLANSGSQIGSGGYGISPNGSVTQGVPPINGIAGPVGIGQQPRIGEYDFNRAVYDPKTGQQMTVPSGIQQRYADAVKNLGVQRAMGGLSPEDRNFFQAYRDAYDKPSGASQLAGGLLSAYGAYNPLFGAALTVNNAAGAKPPSGIGGGDYIPPWASQMGGQPGGSVPAPGQPDYSGFFTSPNYQFTRQEGQRDLQNSFAARGGGQSGNALRALSQYNQGLASNEFNNYFNQQATLAGLGNAATSQASGLAQNTGNNVGNLMQNAANARASGISGSTNALTGGIADLLSWYGKNGNPFGKKTTQPVQDWGGMW